MRPDVVNVVEMQYVNLDDFFNFHEVENRFWFPNKLYVQEKFGFSRFQTLDEIYNWLDNLVLAYPNNVEIIVGGKSFEGRPIKGVKLTFAPDKSAVFVEAGIHAREWLSHSTATFLINDLLTSNDQDVRNLAKSFDWYIFPCFNPDGYVFTHLDVSYTFVQDSNNKIE